VKFLSFYYCFILRHHNFSFSRISRHCLRIILSMLLIFLVLGLPEISTPLFLSHAISLATVTNFSGGAIPQSCFILLCFCCVLHRFFSSIKIYSWISRLFQFDPVAPSKVSLCFDRQSFDSSSSFLR